MIGFLIGLLLGGLVGVMFMALFQINKEHTEKEDAENERNHTDD